MPMIAYNNEWLHNVYAREQADEAYDNNCISADTHANIYRYKPVGFYTPNYFARIGLGLLTILIISSSLGLLGSLFSLFHSISIYLVLSAVALYIALENLVIANMRHYNSGIDNIFLVFISGFLTGAIFNIFYDYQDAHYIAIAFFSMLVFTFLAIRFADSFMAVLGCICLFLFAFFVFSEMGAYGKAFMPFFIIVISGVLYFICIKTAKENELILYRRCLSSVSVVELIVLYAAGNYYVVAALGNEMFGNNPGMHSSMPLGWFFWLWTIAVPVVYVYVGVKRKNAVLLRLGLILTGAAVATFRYYYSILSADKAMIIGGIIVTSVSYILIRYLHTPKNGFTLESIPHKKQTPQLDELFTQHMVNKVTSVSPHDPAATNDNTTDNTTDNTW